MADQTVQIVGSHQGFPAWETISWLLRRDISRDGGEARETRSAVTARNNVQYIKRELV